MLHAQQLLNTHYVMYLIPQISPGVNQHNGKAMTCVKKNGKTGDKFCKINIIQQDNNHQCVYVQTTKHIQQFLT